MGREEVGGGGSRWEEAGRGGALQPRLENLSNTDPLEEGGAHCWNSSFGSITPPPLLSLSLPPLPPPPSAHTDTVFLYFFTAAYRVIVETYARWCADMCAGLGSTGRVREPRCTGKKHHYFLPSSSFSLPPLPPAPFWVVLLDCIVHVALPGSTCHQTF